MFGKNSDADSDLQSSSNNKSSHEDVFTPNHDVSAFVGEGVEFKGAINYQGTVRIDGKLEGEIHTTGVLIVGQGAVIEAKIEAGTIICKGKIVGDIVAREKIQLVSPAMLNGSVKTPSLSMGEGVLFNGTCEMGPIETVSYTHLTLPTNREV